MGCCASNSVRPISSGNEQSKRSGDNYIVPSPREPPIPPPPPPPRTRTTSKSASILSVESGSSLSTLSEIQNFSAIENTVVVGRDVEEIPPEPLQENFMSTFKRKFRRPLAAKGLRKRPQLTTVYAFKDFQQTQSTHVDDLVQESAHQHGHDVNGNKPSNGWVNGSAIQSKQQDKSDRGPKTERWAYKRPLPTHVLADAIDIKRPLAAYAQRPGSARIWRSYDEHSFPQTIAS